MKHQVTVKTETKKHFLGIPYTVTEKQRITVDGKTYRRMKQEAKAGQRNAGLSEEEIAAAHLLVWEEEFEDD